MQQSLACSLIFLAPMLVGASESHIQYVVRPGEHLQQITSQHLNPTHTWRDLARANKLTAPHTVQVGQRLQVPIAWLSAKPASAKLVQLSGDVNISGPSADWQVARPDTQLQADHRIKVGKNSTARLVFADGSVMDLQPDTLLVLDTLSLYAAGQMIDTRARLQSGRVEIRANPKGLSNQRLDIITPSAVTAVRGTQFLVEAQTSKTIAQTSEGKVELKNSQGNAMVTAGYSSLVNEGQKPAAPTLTKPAPQLNQAKTLFDDFPVGFNILANSDTNAWIAQIGLSDKQQVTTLAQQITTSSPHIDLGLIENGQYQLRTWSTDTAGIPSKITQHPFEVNIPRQLLRSAIKISPTVLTQGFELRLAPLEKGQRYLLQLTKDPQGKQTIWYAHNVPQNTTVTAKTDAPENNHHLWIWVY